MMRRAVLFGVDQCLRRQSLKTCQALEKQFTLGYAWLARLPVGAMPGFASFLRFVFLMRFFVAAQPLASQTSLPGFYRRGT